MSSPVAAPRGRSHTASIGFTWRGLVQIAFWSNKNRRGAPARVISSGPAAFDGTGVGAWALSCGTGASGNELETLVETSAVADCEEAPCAGHKRPIESRRDAVKQRQVLSLGRVTGIVRVREVVVRKIPSLAGGYHSGQLHERNGGRPERPSFAHLKFDASAEIWLSRGFVKITNDKSGLLEN